MSDTRLIAVGVLCVALFVVCAVLLILDRRDARRRRRDAAKRRHPATRPTTDEMVKRTRITTAKAFSGMRREAKVDALCDKDVFAAPFEPQWSKNEHFVIHLHTGAEFMDIDTRSDVDR